jgi:hypothetical protein
MVIHCWGCKREARFIWWSKLAGWFNPSCGICPVPDVSTPGDMVFLTTSDAAGDAK